MMEEAARHVVLSRTFSVDHPGHSGRAYTLLHYSSVYSSIGYVLDALTGGEN